MKCKLLSALILLICFSVNTFAQKATVSFTATTDHIPGDQRRNDHNGDPCALVKVQVVDDIDRVEGNRIGAIVKKGVEKWVYMCKGSRNIRIHLKNHLPVKVMFQDYNINGLEGNRVYELTIEVPNNVASEQVPVLDNDTQTGVVTANTKSSESRVIAKNQSTVKNTQHNGTIVGTTKVEKHKKDTKLKKDSHPTRDTNSKKDSKIKKIENQDIRQEEKYAKNESVLSLLKDDNILSVPIRLNKSFTYTHNGVTFKCKAKNGYVTIKAFNTNAIDVIIPAKVMYKDKYYPVVAIDTYMIGYNYGVTHLEIQEGIKKIEKYAFSEFRQLQNVTIPKSVVEIGPKAFRPNNGLKIHAPSDININAVYKGKAIKVNRKNQ